MKNSSWKNRMGNKMARDAKPLKFQFDDLERVEDFRRSDEYKRKLVEVVAFVKKPRTFDLSVGEVSRHFADDPYISGKLRELLDSAIANGDISEEFKGSFTRVFPFGKELKLKPLWYGWNRSQRID